MASYRAPFKTSEYQFSAKVIYPFFYELLKFVGNWSLDLTIFFRKNRHFCLGHMIHQNGPEFPQDHEYAIQKILRPLVLELLPKNDN